MFDDLQRLRDASGLCALLTHYATLAAPDRQAWQHRRGDLDGCDARQLSRLHGELIASGWIEQNTGVVPGCYRATREGLRALRDVHEASGTT